MEPYPEAELSEQIASAVAEVKEARQRLKAALHAAQITCEHRIVHQKTYISPNQNARRICAHCRLEEVGSHWSAMGNDTSFWSREDHSTSILGNDLGRVVLPISHEDYFALVIRP